MESRRQPAWLQRQLRLLVAIDALAAAGATLLSQLLAFGQGNAVLDVRGMQIPYAAGVILTVPTWLCLVGTAGCYDLGPFGVPSRETRRVISAGAHFLAVVAVAYYLAHIEQLGRGFVMAIVPLAAGLTLLGRAVARWELNQRIGNGHAVRRALLVGPPDNLAELVTRISARPSSGILVAGTVSLNGSDPSDLVDTLARVDADLLVITGATEPGTLRTLTWQLEGSGVQCLVAPAASQLIGPHFDVRPIAGLPLLYVDRASLATVD